MHLTSTSNDTTESRPRTAGWFIVALLAAFTSFAWWLGRDDGRARALESLSDADRVALFEATTKTFTTVCTVERSNVLADFCHEQGLLLLRFPECDASCRENARQKMRQPTR